MKLPIKNSLLAGLLFVSFIGTAQSDDPCGAVSLPVNSGCTFQGGTNVGSTNTAGVPAPGCAFYSGNDVWYAVTVPASGSVNLDMNTGGMTDSGMAAYSGPCGSLSLIECDDDDSPNGLMSALNLTGLTPGSTIYIRVWDYGGGTGSFQICASNPGGGGGGGPANDDPCSATALPVNASCSFSTYTNASATASAGVPAPGCANYLGGDVWFTVTVPASGNVTIDMNTGVITDAGMAVYSGPCNALSLIECDDDDSANGLMSMIALTGQTPGATLYVRVWEYGNNNNGTFDICAHDPGGGGGGGTPPNDDPCNAISLSVDASCNFATYTNANATNTSLTVPGFPLPTCANFQGGDVWFSVTVPPSGHVIFDSNTGTITDGGMAIYRGPDCNNLTELDCDDDGSANGLMPMIDQSTLIPGEAIWIRMWEYGNDNNGTFDICAHDGGAGGGGPCAGGAGGADCPVMAPICTGNTYCYTAGTGTSASAGNDYGCLFTQPNPSWYYFEIATAGNLIFDLQAQSDIDFALWGPYANVSAANANCGSLPAPLDCSYSTSPTEQVVANGVNPGEVYILLVTNYAGVVQDITLFASAGNTASTNCAIVLPVELANLHAVRSGNDVQVQWETVSEYNNDYFAVEASVDGRIWKTVGIQRGAGNSTSTLDYALVDDKGILEGSNYYRLKQFDTDGKLHISKVVSVEDEGDLLASDVHLTPNPAKDVVTISSKEQFNGVVINDLNGMTVKEIATNWTKKTNIDISELSQGVYMVQITTDSGTEMKRLIVK